MDEAGKPVSLQNAGDSRATTGMFGAGYLEMLARQMTEELQRTRDTIRIGETKALSAKGISFGTLTLTKAGVWDTSHVEGLGRLSLISIGHSNPPTLVIRPWHQASNVVSLREFTNTAFNQHHGIQSTERFGLDTDPDGDGFTNELTRADVTAVSVWQATLQVPGRVIPRDPAVERAVLEGERTFERIGCATCHVPRLPLDKQGWIFSEPNPFNVAGNLRTGETRELKVDLSSALLPAPRLQPDATGTVWVEAYTDFKLHNICEPGERGAARPEPVAVVGEDHGRQLPLPDQAAVGRGERAAVFPSWSVHDASPLGARALGRSEGIASRVRVAARGRARRGDRVPQDAAGAAAGHEGTDRRRHIQREEMAAVRSGPDIAGRAGTGA